MSNTSERASRYHVMLTAGQQNQLRELIAELQGHIAKRATPIGEVAETAAASQSYQHLSGSSLSAPGSGVGAEPHPSFVGRPAGKEHDSKNVLGNQNASNAIDPNDPKYQCAPNLEHAQKQAYGYKLKSIPQQTCTPTIV